MLITLVLLMKMKKKCNDNLFLLCGSGFANNDQMTPQRLEIHIGDQPFYSSK